MTTEFCPPIFMGAGYGAGAYFFARVFLGRRWYAGAARAWDAFDTDNWLAYAYVAGLAAPVHKEEEPQDG